MFADNPYSSVAGFLPALFMPLYMLVMVLAVIVGTWVDVASKGSARFFKARNARARMIARYELTGPKVVSIAARTALEAAVSGEFRKWPRRLSHLITAYGFGLYVTITMILVFAYAGTNHPPVILPILWDLGAFMVFAGGLWFFLCQRVNVASDGAHRLHLGQADLFVGTLIASATLGLLWHLGEAWSGNGPVTLTLFGLYLFFTALLFGTIPWSKFAHMFYKPAVAYQEKVETATGASPLPEPERRSPQRG